MERFCDIKQKEVVNIFDGRCIGHVFDLVIDCRCGTICAIIVPGCSKLRSCFFGGGDDIIIPWNKIVKIGRTSSWWRWRVAGPSDRARLSCGTGAGNGRAGTKYRGRCFLAGPFVIQ